MTGTCRSLMLVAILMIASLAVHAGRVERAASGTDARSNARLNPAVWKGPSPDKQSDFLLVASNEGTLDDPSGNVMLTVFAKKRGSVWNQLVKTAEWPVREALYVFEVTVYRNVLAGKLVCGICIGGGDATGVSVVSIDNSGRVRKLYSDVNWGNPRLELKNGKLRVVEVWPIFRLEEKYGWKPTKEYKGHVLAERVFLPRVDGVFVLHSTRVAVEEENRLSKQDRLNLEDQQRRFEKMIKQDWYPDRQ